MKSTHTEERVLIIAPVAHDAPAMAAVLDDEGLQTQVCQTVDECVRHIMSGAGTLLLTEEALESAQLSDLLLALESQAPWSELPVIILTSGGESRRAKVIDLAANAAGTLILLERPVGTRTLLQSVQVALRSRRRQYQARDLLSQLGSLNATLEQRVAQRTIEAVERAEKLRILTAELSAAEERERRRIAEILHEDLQQLLMAARVHFGMLCKVTDCGKRAPIEHEIVAILDRSFALTRSLSIELAPPVLYEDGLAAALQWLGTKTQKEHGVLIKVEADPFADPENGDLRVFLFRAVRELLLNALKHAGGSRVHLRSRRSKDGGKVCIIVTDHGPGFDHTTLEKRRAGSTGLFNIRERVGTFGGEFHIQSAPGRGTQVTLAIPCVFRSDAR